MSESVHIGQLRDRIVLERPLRAGDGGGGATVTWEEVTALWAKVTPSGGSESYELDRVAGKASHEIVIRYRADVTPELRFRAGARVFDVCAAFDPDGRRQWIKCLVEERDL
jgi:SPP1 family predicted phage head-tail adaptor